MSDEKSEAMATIQCTAGAAPERKRDGSHEKGGKDADVDLVLWEGTNLLPIDDGGLARRGPRTLRLRDAGRDHHRAQHVDSLRDFVLFAPPCHITSLYPFLHTPSHQTPTALHHRHHP